MKKYLIILFLLIGSILLLPTTVYAADQILYVRDGASGTTCADWGANACDELSAAEGKINRASFDSVKIYVADGTYGPVTINAAVSGEKMIYVYKATAAAHGTDDENWNNAYGDGQAIMLRPTTTVNEQPTVQISTSYVTWDGVVGSGSDKTAYGFRFDPPTDGCATYAQTGMYIYAGAGMIYDHITVKHTAFIGCGDHDPKCSNGIKTAGANATARIQNIEIADNYIEEFSNSVVLFRVSDGAIHDNYLASNWSATYCHGQQIAPDDTDDISLYDNTFANTEYALFSAHSNLGPNYRWKIYNNLVLVGTEPFNIWINGGGTTNKTNDGKDCIVDSDIHHNTHVGVAVASWGAIDVGVLSDPATKGSRFYNNLFYDCSNPKIQNCAGCGATDVLHDNNAYLKCTGTYPGNGTVTAEAAGQVDTEATDVIFTDYDEEDFTINAANQFAIDHIIGKGKTLASPFDIDYLGVSRTAPFDIGAYDVGGEADTTAPTLAEVTPAPASSSNQAPSYVFSSDEAGTVTYGGTCGNGSLSTAVVGDNTVQWNLAIGTYSDCTITVTDTASNASTPLAVTEFVITPAISSASKVIEGGVTFMRLP